MCNTFVQAWISERKSFMQMTVMHKWADHLGFITPAPPDAFLKIPLSKKETVIIEIAFSFMLQRNELGIGTVAEAVAFATQLAVSSDRYIAKASE